MYKELEIIPEYTTDYIVDEIKYYLEKKYAGKTDLFTLNNAIKLTNLAKINEKITNEQAKEIIDVIEQIRHLK